MMLSAHTLNSAALNDLLNQDFGLFDDPVYVDVCVVVFEFVLSWPFLLGEI